MGRTKEKGGGGGGVFVFWGTLLGTGHPRGFVFKRFVLRIKEVL